MIDKDWMVGKVVSYYPQTEKIFARYNINVGCCYDYGHMTLEQVSLRLNISIGDFLDMIRDCIQNDK